LEEKKEENNPNDLNIHSTLPSLHIWGEKDQYLPPQRSAALAAIYSDPVIYVHSKGHFVPQSGADCKVYREFLEQFVEYNDWKKLT